MKNFALLTDSSYELLTNGLEKLNVNITPIELGSDIKTTSFDAFVFALDSLEPRPELKKLIQQFHEDSSSIGAFKHSPLIVSEALGDYGVALTMADEFSNEIEKHGAQYVECEDDDFITDRQNKVVSSPINVNEVGMDKALAELFEMS